MIPAAEMAFGKPYGVTRVGIAQPEILKPGDRFLKIFDAGIDRAGLDLPYPRTAFAIAASNGRAPRASASSQYWTPRPASPR